MFLSVRTSEELPCLYAIADESMTLDTPRLAPDERHHHRLTLQAREELRNRPGFMPHVHAWVRTSPLQPGPGTLIMLVDQYATRYVDSWPGASIEIDGFLVSGPNNPKKYQEPAKRGPWEQLPLNVARAYMS